MESSDIAGLNEKMDQPLWKMLQQFFEKLNTELPRDHANPLLGTCPKEMKTGVQTNTCTHMFREAIFTTVKR